jgi:hypothetical protein
MGRGYAGFFESEGCLLYHPKPHVSSFLSPKNLPLPR